MKRKPWKAKYLNGKKQTFANDLNISATTPPKLQLKQPHILQSRPTGVTQMAGIQSNLD